MLTSKAYKRMLAASVLTAVMGTGSVFAAEVQTGYTPDMNATATADTATTDDTTYTMRVQKRVLIHKIILMRQF